MATLGEEGVAAPGRGEAPGTAIAPDGDVGQTLAATVRAQTDEAGRPRLPVDEGREIPGSPHLVIVVTGPVGAPAMEGKTLADG